MALGGRKRNFRATLGRLAAALAAGLMPGCRGVELVQQLLDDRPPRERYESRLESAGLAETALVRDWIAAGDRALTEAAPVSSPHAEQGYLPPAEPAALGFLVSLKRGQEIAFGVELSGDTASQLFLDAWTVERDTLRPFRRVAAADSGARELRFEPRRDGDYILRAQPELLRGGRFIVTLRVGPTLTFPVLNARESDVGSVFGDARDGGERSHHGIDIFAPRGAVAVAATEAVVTRVGSSARGGNVVWLRDPRGYSLYYAHLDRQHVREGMQVQPGDTVGFVGNTGNAITTPPHLHFAVYRRGEGPLDPWWFVHQPGVSPPGVLSDTMMLGLWVRTRGDRAPLLAGPAPGAEERLTLPRHTTVRALAAIGAWYRVRLPDGRTGYVPSARVEPAERAVEIAAPAEGSRLLASPGPAGPSGQIVALTVAGDSLHVLGRFGDYLYVRTPGGRTGWVGGAAQ